MATFNGTTGNDTITPGFVSPGVVGIGAIAPTAGADSLNGGGGNDTLDGGLGADTIQGGAGDDLVRWSFGSGNDLIDGGAGTDTLLYFGNNGLQDPITLTGNAGHVTIQGLSGSVLDITNVEQLVIAPMGGTDVVTINDVWDGVPVMVNVDLGVGGVADGQPDTVIVNASAHDDQVVYVRSQGVLSTFTFDPTHSVIQGVAPIVGLSNAESIDRLVINGGVGNDILRDVETPQDVTVFPGNPAQHFNGPVPHITLNGGDGDDILAGSAGDTLNGGAGNDWLLLGGGNSVGDGGAGNDIIYWPSIFGLASAVIKGGDGFDIAGTNLTSSSLSTGSDGTVILTEPGGSTAVFQNVEIIAIEGDPSDESSRTISIGDLSSTTVQEVGVNLHEDGNLDDGRENTVNITGGGAANHIGIVAGPNAIDASQVSVTGLTNPNTTGPDPSRIGVFEAGQRDTIVVDGGAGNDTIDVFSVGFTSTLDIRGGAGNDTISASQADFTDGNRLSGDLGNDSINGGGGGGFLQGGSGNDTLTSGGNANFIFNAGEGGSDVVLSFNTLGQHIVLNGAVDRTFDAAIADHHIFESNGNTVVTNGTSVIVTLMGTHLSSLTASDFIFN